MADSLDIMPPPEWFARAQWWVFSRYLAWWLGRRGVRSMLVTSGFRDDKKNHDVGGAYNSAHLAGLAADVAIPSARMEELAAAWRAHGPDWYAAPNPSRGYVHFNAPRNIAPPFLFAALALVALVLFLWRSV